MQPSCNPVGLDSRLYRRDDMLNSFSLGTFNALNLVLPNVVFYNDERYTQEEYDKKITWQSEQLRRMNADIVGFQEVFHQEALEHLASASGLYPIANVIAANPKGTGPVVGLMSKLPLQTGETQIIDTFPEEAYVTYEGAGLPITKFSRPVLKVKVRLSEGLMATVFVVHLKSKRPLFPQGFSAEQQRQPLQEALGKTRSLILRAAEAVALRGLLLRELRDTNAPVIVVGDTNDGATAVTSEIFTGSPPFKKFPSELKKPIWDVLLYNVKDIQSRQSYHDVYYTHIFNGHYEALDHIFISQEFFRSNPAHLGYVENVRVLNDHLLDETLTNDEVPKWQSDHGQVVAKIILRND